MAISCLHPQWHSPTVKEKAAAFSDAVPSYALSHSGRSYIIRV